MEYLEERGKVGWAFLYLREPLAGMPQRAGVHFSAALDQ